MTVASEYLARLDDALRSVPRGVAAEIRAGIAEELQSLDAEGAAERIVQLGDPAVIAREAMDAGEYAEARISAPVAVPGTAPAASPASVPVSHRRGFAIAAALSLSFGGYVLPFVGWIIGVGLVVMSSMWRTWEKTVAIIVPLALFGALALAATVSAAALTVTESGDATEIGAAAADDSFAGNLFAGPHLFIILAVVVLIPASGLWLLWRMRGRAAS